jgi:two-component system sensor kinase FixL
VNVDLGQTIRPVVADLAGRRVRRYLERAPGDGVSESKSALPLGPCSVAVANDVMKWRVETRVFLGFALALGLLVAMGVLILQSTQTLFATYLAAQRSQQAIADLGQIDSLMSQAEAGERLYLSSGDADDLRQRAQALARVDQLIGNLRGATADEPELSAGLQALEQRVADRKRVLDAVLDVKQQEGAEEAQALLQRSTGGEEMQQLRDSVSGMQRAERARLDLRERTVHANARRTAIFVALLFAFALAAVLLLYVASRRAMRRRRRAQEDFKRQTEELRANETRLRAVVETAIDGIIVIDQRGIVDRFNRAAERLFGYAAVEVVGHNVSMLMPSPDREQHDGYLARYLGGGKPHIIGVGREVVARRKDGTTFPIDLAVNEMQVGGRRMFTGILHDIAERKRAEEQRLHLIQELQSFAYVVSHDLKAPLRAIGSLADWIDSDYGQRLDAEGRTHLQLLRARVRRMDALIDGILEYSRAGRVRERIVAVPTERVVKETIDLLAPPPNIQVTIEGSLPTVAAEPTRVRQVFQNLLSRDGMWEFSVADNGPGIDAQHHARIFQLFQTLAPRDRIDSTGVGLTLVKKIVELYGGRVWVESIPGQGSAFHFTLPRTAPGAEGVERTTS